MPADMRRWQLAVALVALVALVAAGRVQGQGIADLPAGARVRITLPDSARPTPLTPRARTVIGTLARATSDTLWLQIAGADTVRVPRAVPRRVEVSRGVSRARSALEQGLLMGVGFVVLSTANDSDSGPNAGQSGAIGLAFGALIGALSPYERWRRVR